MKTITTNRLLIRPIQDSDLPHIFQGLSHPEVIRYYGVSFNSLEATKEQMKWYADDKQCWFAICSRDNEAFYGAAGFNDISQDHRKAEIGMWLLPEYWGLGIMQESFPSICDYGFKELGLHRIEGFVEEKNENCQRAMAKLDFEKEGVMKDCEWKNGQWISVAIYAKLNNSPF